MTRRERQTIRKDPILQNGRKIRTSNELERRLVTEAIESGWEVYKRGWPDFLLIKGDSVFAVEVKPKDRILTRDQRRVARVLEGKDIPVFVAKDGELPSLLRE